MYTHLQRDVGRPPVTLATLARMKADGEKIASLTCYDASFAVLLDAADVDVVLVGDSLGMVIQGHDTTVPVTMDQIVYHSATVARGLHRPFQITDLPFMSYPSKERGARQLRAPDAGGRRADGQAGKRRQADRDRRVPHRPRHRRVRARGTQAPVGAQDRRLSRAGARAGRGAAPADRGQGAGGRRRRHRAARVHPGGAGEADHRRRCTCR